MSAGPDTQRAAGRYMRSFLGEVTKWLFVSFPPKIGQLASVGLSRLRPGGPMKAGRQCTDGQNLTILQKHQGGVTAKEVIRRHGIALDTFYRWRRKYSGVDKAELQRLKALEDENRRLKRVVADQPLNIQVLRDALGRECDAPAVAGGRH